MLPWNDKELLPQSPREPSKSQSAAGKEGKAPAGAAQVQLLMGTGNECGAKSTFPGWRGLPKAPPLGSKGSRRDAELETRFE